MSWELPSLRAGREPDQSLLSRRQAFAGPAPALPPGVVAEDRSISGVPCVVLTPAEWRCELIYLHGGGYRLGAPAGWLPLAARLASAARARVTLVDYRLAPEHPFPAAVHDAVGVYRSVREGGAPESRILVGGDSAGGGLAAVVTVVCGLTSMPRPDGLILFSPWLDLTFSGETHASHAARDLLFPPATSTDAAETYLQGAPADDPLVSPLFADVAGFPPALIFAGTEETLLSDSLRFSERLGLAGTAVTLRIGAGMQHVWPLLDPHAAETATAFELVRVFAQGLPR